MTRSNNTYRNSPIPIDTNPQSLSQGLPGTPPLTQSHKRPHSNPSTNHSFDTDAPTAKKLRETPGDSPSRVPDEKLRERHSSLAGSPRYFDRHRSSSPSQVSFLEVAATMLNRPEDTGGTRTLKLARGTAGSPIPARPSPIPLSRSPSGHRDNSISRTTSETKKPSGTQILHSVGLSEYLQLDERPTLVVDTFDETNLARDGLNLVFANNALKSRPVLLDNVQGIASDATVMLDLGTPFADFKSWALTQSNDPDVVSSFPFSGILWKTVLIRKRLRIITGLINPISPQMTENVNRPSLQQFRGLGSASSLPPRVESSSGVGYFDVKPKKSVEAPPVSETQGREASNAASSPGSPGDYAHATSGDLGYSDLLTGSLSPTSEQITLPGPVINETLDPMSPEAILEKGFFDWTRLPISPSLPAHIQFARAINWSGTSLGAIEEWSADLRGMCNLIMASPHPSAMYWGKDHVAIYNEAYILLAGQKHPSLMGSRYRDAWSEIWHALEEVFDSAYNSAQATMKDDDCLFIMRNGFLEETYFSWSIIPLIGDDGSVVGLYNPAFEKTRRKIAERRMLTLREIGERTAAARKVSEFWPLLIEGLDYNEFDAPMVMVYSLAEDTSDADTMSSTSSGGAATKICYLEGSLGVPIRHPAAPETIDLKTSTSVLASVFRQALTTDRPIVLREDDGSLDLELIEGIEWRGFGDPSKIVVVTPIHPTTGESTLGFLVMGTNPRRPYDEDYDLFVQLLGRQLATSIASVVLFEDEIKKGERAARLAAQDRIDLNNQLVARTQEAVEAEYKFTRMAELAPVGIFIGASDGSITYVNDVWYDITSYPRNIEVGDNWMNYILEEDQAKALDCWSTMMTQKGPVSIEVRFKTPWRDELGNEGHTWVLASASPEKDEDGQISGIFGSLTDISAQKFAEDLKTKRMEEAVERKQQHERYIDTTSHEMRNPLSAILQCADSIAGSLAEMKEANDLSETQKELLDLTIDSAQTITLCAQHQKRIVDDVLTMSKLDSAMLAVTPVDSQPISVIQMALKMFEGELQTADIAVEFVVDESYTILEIDWVRIDPHRLSQVLINLMTNAIKFTTTQEKRTIRVHLAASKEKPSQEDKWQLTYIPTRIAKDMDVTAAAEWGLGDAIYVHFAVQDTGRGLDQLEKKQLFQRFQQANPRTHVTYGGSGLGLFISRELVELQGGEIGVASESGKGSTFAFYIKARRSHAPIIRRDSDEQLAGYNPRKLSKGKFTKLKSQSLPQPGSSPSVSPNLPPTVSSSENPLQVLIVEDNLINQKVLAAQLRKIGCEVYVANHGGEALVQLQASKFYKTNVKDGIEINVVLMDLEMPIMDGQTCVRKIREMQAKGDIVKHVPIIAVTANAREEQINMARESGVDDVVSKPFRIPELVPKMRDVISRFRNNLKLNS